MTRQHAALDRRRKPPLHRRFAVLAGTGPGRRLWTLKAQRPRLPKSVLTVLGSSPATEVGRWNWDVAEERAPGTEVLVLSRAATVQGLGIRGLLLGLALVAMALTGCTASAAGGNPSAAGTPLRLGYFPNITHATAIVGVEGGILAKRLGTQATLELATFNAGSSAVEALLSGAIDATFIGPNPAINAYAKTKGEAIRIIAGATSGGSFLVVKPEIGKAADLRGRRLATPQLGNTQDVALRVWLLNNGLSTDTSGGGDVSIIPQDNAQTLATFVAGDIAGAWVPEPWASRLVLEGKGKVLVDERTLWPGGQYVTTHLVVRTDYLRANPAIVKLLLQAHVEANALVNSDPVRARELTIKGIERITGAAISPAVVEAAWKNLVFTLDPIASSLKTSAENAVTVGVLQPVDLAGIYDLGPLNELLRAEGAQEVPGL